MYKHLVSLLTLILVTLITLAPLAAQRGPQPQFRIVEAETYDVVMKPGEVNITLDPIGGDRNVRSVGMIQERPFYSSMWFGMYPYLDGRVEYEIQFAGADRFPSEPTALALNIDGKERILKPKRNGTRYNDDTGEVIYSMWFTVDRQLLADIWMASAVFAWTPLVGEQRFRTVTVTGKDHSDMGYQIGLIITGAWLPEPQSRINERLEQERSQVTPYSVQTTDTSRIHSVSVTQQSRAYRDTQPGLVFIIEEQAGQYQYFIEYHGVHAKPFPSGLKAIKIGGGRTVRLYPLLKKDIITSKTKTHITITMRVPSDRAFFEEMLERPEPFSWQVEGGANDYATSAIISGHRHELDSHLGQLKQQLEKMLAATAR